MAGPAELGGPHKSRLHRAGDQHLFISLSLVSFYQALQGRLTIYEVDFLQRRAIHLMNYSGCAGLFTARIQRRSCARLFAI